MSTPRAPASKPSSNSTIPEAWITDPATESWSDVKAHPSPRKMSFMDSPPKGFALCLVDGSFLAKLLKGKRNQCISVHLSFGGGKPFWGHSITM